VEPLLLVTHARSDGKFDNGILSEAIPEAVKEFPGTTAHISANPDVPQISGGSEEPYGGEEIYDIVVEDNWHGFIEQEDAEELLQYEPISRAGSQYNNCCGNTDMALSTYADRDLQLTYFTDLTVYEENNQLDLLSEKGDHYRPDGVDVGHNLEFQYGTYFD
jgi:hypothetical protein